MSASKLIVSIKVMHKCFPSSLSKSFKLVFLVKIVFVTFRIVRRKFARFYVVTYMAFVVAPSLTNANRCTGNITSFTNFVINLLDNKL